LQLPLRELSAAKALRQYLAPQTICHAANSTVKEMPAKNKEKTCNSLIAMRTVVFFEAALRL
jgi:hypothetical protein